MQLADVSHLNGHLIDWGNVPAWVSSILTSGSLLLGFYIILRDRRKDEKEQAAKIVIWQEAGHVAGDRDRIAIRLANVSDRPIFAPRVVAVPPGGRALEPVASFRRMDEELRDLPVGTVSNTQEVLALCPEGVSAATATQSMMVEFADAAGQIWYYSLSTTRLAPKKFRSRDRAVNWYKDIRAQYSPN